MFFLNQSNKKIKLKESTGDCGGVSDCSASRVLKSRVIILPEEQQRKTYSRKTCHQRKPRDAPQHHERWRKIDETIENENKIRLSFPTMHCFTTAPFRKLVFQKGTEPSCTSSTLLLVKGKKGYGTCWSLSSQHRSSRRFGSFSSKLCGFSYSYFQQKWRDNKTSLELLWGEQRLLRF